MSDAKETPLYMINDKKQDEAITAGVLSLSTINHMFGRSVSQILPALSPYRRGALLKVINKSTSLEGLIRALDCNVTMDAPRCKECMSCHFLTLPNEAVYPLEILVGACICLFSVLPGPNLAKLFVTNASSFGDEQRACIFAAFAEQPSLTLYMFTYHMILSDSAFAKAVSSCQRKRFLLGMSLRLSASIATATWKPVL
jgi:hypothetical protein